MIKLNLKIYQITTSNLLTIMKAFREQQTISGTRKIKIQFKKSKNRKQEWVTKRK